MTTQTLLEAACASYQIGDFKEAKTQCEQFLQTTPNDFNALHLMGVIALQQKQFDVAQAWLEKAKAIHSRSADVCIHLAHALRGAGKIEEALKLLQDAQGLAVNRIDLLLEIKETQGLLLRNLGRNQEALAAYDAALAIKPDKAMLWVYRGNALADIKNVPVALDSFRRAIELDPNCAFAYVNRSALLSTLHQEEAALKDCEQAIALMPQYAQAYVNQGNALQMLGRYGKAQASYKRAIELEPHHAQAHHNLGIVYLEEGKYALALECFEAAIGLNSNSLAAAESMAYAAKSLNGLKQYDRALAYCEQALAIDPNHALSYVIRGIVFNALCDEKAALANYNQALKLHFCAQTLTDRGLVYQQTLHLEEALADHEMAMRLEPDLAAPHLNAAIAYLLQGRWKLGWQGHEWRWKANRITLPRFKAPQWLGRADQPLRDKTILLYPEQGAGDVLQFARYTRLLAEQGAKVLMVAYPGNGLNRLLSNLNGVSNLLVEGDPLPSIDYWSPILSLPFAFQTVEETIPWESGGYLRANTRDVAKWKKQLARFRRPRVGLVWRGNPLHKNDHNRSIVLKCFQECLAMPLDWVILQKDLSDAEREYLRSFPNVHSVMDGVKDFADTAAVIMNLDLVLSVDTSIAHLSGALNKPTWVLLPFYPDWRWLMNRTDSPWYPSLRLFRQQTPGQWKRVFEECTQALRAML